MGVTLLTFCAVFLLIASLGLLLFYREAMIQRITEVINPQSKPKTLLSTLQQTGISLSEVVVQFQNVLPKSQAEVSVAQQRLIRAGYRKESAVKVFYGCKVLVPLSLCAIALVTGLGNLSPFFVYVLCLGLGYLAPDFWLGRMISKRQSKIRRGLPDVLDLLIICIEAGLSLDQATARTAEELRTGQPEQFGTSIAKTLRIHSDTLRTQRVQAVEEAAAKTTIKLIFPLVFFIFPSLFLVALGPAVISMMDSFKLLNGGH